MAKRNTDNLRIKRKYLVWLKDAKGFSDATIDKAAASISRYEVYVKGADFRGFHVEKARGFKRHLSAARNEKTRAPLAQGTIAGTLHDLKAFFGWLADMRPATGLGFGMQMPRISHLIARVPAPRMGAAGSPIRPRNRFVTSFPKCRRRPSSSGGTGRSSPSCS